ncbi:hypothetical protein H1R20_g12330, partial [Candolleomyces eurysporus]
MLVRNVNASSSFRGLGRSSLVSIGRQAPQVSVESYLNNVAGTQVVGYNCVASLAFLIYDILLTLHQEWYGRESLSTVPNFVALNTLDSISWNLTKCLFFFIRYFPVILQISVLFVGTPPFTFTKRECYIWNVYQGLATVLIVAAVDYILILRIFALYSRNRTIRYLVATLYLLELVTMSIGVGLAVPKLGYDDLCTLIDVPDTFLIAAGAPIAFQTILFALTAWRFLEAVKAGWGNVPIIQLLMRDGTWAFILLFAILLGEAFLYGFAPEAYTDVLYGWLNTAFAFCVRTRPCFGSSLILTFLFDSTVKGYRILLNLNQLNASARPSIYVTSPDIVFSSQVVTGPFSEESYQLTNLSRSPISSTPGSSSQSDARQFDRDE